MPLTLLAALIPVEFVSSLIFGGRIVDVRIFNISDLDGTAAIVVVVVVVANVESPTKMAAAGAVVVVAVTIADVFDRICSECDHCVTFPITSDR